jgi:hypothetical protein
VVETVIGLTAFNFSDQRSGLHRITALLAARHISTEKLTKLAA